MPIISMPKIRMPKVGGKNFGSGSQPSAATHRSIAMRPMGGLTISASGEEIGPRYFSDQSLTTPRAATQSFQGDIEANQSYCFKPRLRSLVHPRNWPRRFKEVHQFSVSDLASCLSEQLSQRKVTPA
jgi:hypothetical protein